MAVDVDSVLQELRQLPSGVQERIVAFAVQLERLDELATLLTPLPRAVETVQDVALRHRLLRDAASQAPLRINFTLDGFIAWQQRQAVLATQGFAWLARRQLLELHLHHLAVPVPVHDEAAVAWLWQHSQNALARLRTLDTANVLMRFRDAVQLAHQLPSLRALGISLATDTADPNDAPVIDLGELPSRVRSVLLRSGLSAVALRPGPEPLAQLVLVADVQLLVDWQALRGSAHSVILHSDNRLAWLETGAMPRQYNQRQQLGHTVAAVLRSFSSSNVNQLTVQARTVLHARVPPGVDPPYRPWHQVINPVEVGSAAELGTQLQRAAAGNARLQVERDLLPAGGAAPRVRLRKMEQPAVDRWRRRALRAAQWLAVAAVAGVAWHVTTVHHKAEKPIKFVPFEVEHPDESLDQLCQQRLAEIVALTDEEGSQLLQKKLEAMGFRNAEEYREYKEATLKSIEEQLADFDRFVSRVKAQASGSASTQRGAMKVSKRYKA